MTVITAYLHCSSLLQMMGGRFRSVMPSNLVYPGACAIESLPAPGTQYASEAAKGELRRLFARSVLLLGCGNLLCGPCAALMQVGRRPYLASQPEAVMGH